MINAINVIQFADRENLNSNPSVRIYECSGSVDASALGERYAIQYLGDHVFIVRINNPAWINFTNALEFTSL